MDPLLICENVGYRKRKISKTLLDSINQRLGPSTNEPTSGQSPVVAEISVPPSPLPTISVRFDKEKQNDNPPTYEEIYPLNYDDLKERAMLNISGVKYEVLWSVLEKYPNTRLGQLRKSFIEREKRNAKNMRNNVTEEKIREKLKTYEFFFEMQPKPFEAILSFYRKGKLHLVDGMCVKDFSDDLHFWGIDEAHFGSCCLLKYQIMFHAIEEEMQQCERFCDKLKQKEIFENIKVNVFRRFIWRIFTSQNWWLSKVMNYATILLIILSVINMVISTVPNLEKNPCRFLIDTEYATKNITACKEMYIFYQDLFLPKDNFMPVLEQACILFFTLEYILRLYISHDKKKFFFSWFNGFDLLCIAPYFITRALLLISIKFQFPQELLFIRILRIFKLARYSTGLRSLGMTFKKSLNEFGILALILTLGVIIFSSLVYIAEKSNRDAFHSIPDSFWWAVITITTVGYGDIVPVTLPGKIIGMITAIFGVVIVALPVATIVKNFGVSYDEQRQREIALKRKVAQARINRKKSNKQEA